MMKWKYYNADETKTYHITRDRKESMDWDQENPFPIYDECMEKRQGACYKTIQNLYSASARQVNLHRNGLLRRWWKI